VNGTASSAVFANTATSSTLTLDGGLTAGAVAIGNGGSNANYTFRTGSLSASAFTLQGHGLNEPAISGYPTSTLTDVSLAVGGDLGIGRAQLVIGGTSVVTANRIGGAGMTGVTSADWGQLTIQDGAIVTATNGIVGATTAWGLNLNGGTLVTSGIDFGPQSFAGSVVNLNFNSGLVVASQNNSDFLTVTGGLDFAPAIQAGGARINTNGFDVGISLPLSGPGRLTKVGGGALTLTGSSTYSGGTMIHTGTVISGFNAPAAGGVLRGGAGVITGLGNTTLTGGTIAVTDGLSGFGWNGSFTLGGNVTVSGSVASAITTAAGGSGAANVQMSNGANGIGGAVVSSASASSTFDLGGTTQTVGGLAASGSSPRAVGWTGDGSGGLSVAFAAPGDTNIDGQLDILDVANFLGAGKYDSGQPAVWNQGDFGYDGLVDILDVADFLGTGLFDAGSYLPASAPAASPAVAPVPEPSSTGAAGFGLALVAWRLARRFTARRTRFVARA
jgi:autotransporter-associated beta strand protein